MATLDFNTMTTRYDPRNALALGQVAKLAYESETTVNAQAAAWGMKSAFASADHLLEGDTQAVVLGDADKVIVAFRGTEPANLRDWVTDAEAILVPGPAGMVHKGFLDALTLVHRSLREIIRTFQDRGQSLWVAGHSLGAALATLFVAKLRFDEDKPVFGLYTFGQPRTGNRDFARAFDADFQSLMFRFVNNTDVVPRVPPRAGLYSHVGTFLYFDETKTLRADPGFWFRRLDALKSAVDDFRTLRPGAVKDHAMTEYLAALERKQPIPA
jgi:triacylglycerol lipase